MFELFSLRKDVSVPTRLMFDWPNISQGLKQNLDTVVDYYKTNDFVVESNHLLVNILTNMGLPMQMDLERYYANLEGKARDLSRVMGLTSSMHRGRVFKNVFFGRDCNELLLYVEDWFDYEAVYNDWRNVRAVKVLRHPVTDLSMLLPTGVKKGSDYGTAVVSIDIPLLGMQYRGFRDHEKALSKKIPNYTQRSVMQFIHMFVLPNMMYSFVDEVLFNRLYCLSLGIPLGETYKRHPFHLTPWDKRINISHRKLIDWFIKNKTDFVGLMKNVPMLTMLNLEDESELPDVAKTRQVMWLLISSKIKVLIWLLSMTERNGSTRNINEINKIKRMFLRIKMNNQIITQLPQAFKETLEEELEEVYRLLNI